MKEEIWKDIEGFDGRYQVSNYGRVWSYARKNAKLLKPKIDKDGYHEYGLTKQGDKKCTYRRAHRLVAMTFIPNPDNLPVINHIDSVKDNNYVSNLEWATVGYNTRHYYDFALNDGSTRPMSSLTKEECAEMVVMYKAGATYGEIKEAFSLSCEKDLLTDFFSGRRCAEVSGITNDIRSRDNNPSLKVNEEIALKVIHARVVDKRPLKCIREEFGLSDGHISVLSRGLKSPRYYAKFLEIQKLKEEGNR